jgi:hypothetical protein
MQCKRNRSVMTMAWEIELKFADQRMATLAWERDDKKEYHKCEEKEIGVQFRHIHKDECFTRSALFKLYANDSVGL